MPVGKSWQVGLLKSMQTTPLPIDFAALTELMGGNHDGVCSLLEIVVGELSAGLNASTVAIAANDWTSLQQIAHRLKDQRSLICADVVGCGE